MFTHDLYSNQCRYVNLSGNCVMTNVLPNHIDDEYGDVFRLFDSRIMKSFKTLNKAAFNSIWSDANGTWLQKIRHWSKRCRYGIRSTTPPRLTFTLYSPIENCWARFGVKRNANLSRPKTKKLLNQYRFNSLMFYLRIRGIILS